MNNQLEVSYENIGISSYLTVTFPSGMEIVGYQLEMITCNEIGHLPAATKRVVDGETVIYYNISSRMALSQVLERRKLTRTEFIRLMEAAVKVGREVKEYQLSEDCLVMDPDYIYVDPASCEPSFLYLPINQTEEGGVKKFLLELVMQGQIEMGGDNFIQAILEVANARPFSPDKLEACLERFKDSRRPPGGRMGVAQGSQGGMHQGRMPEGYQPGASGGFGNDAPAVLSNPEGKQERETDGRPSVPVPPSDTKEGRKKKEETQTPQKASKGKKEKPEPSDDQAGFDPELAKKKFLIPQAIVMVALAALVSFGAFKDMAGGIAVNNVLAVALCVVVAEIILYREIYVNGKKGNKKGKAKAGGRKPGKSEKKAGPPLPGQGNMAVPVPEHIPSPAVPSMHGGPSIPMSAPGVPAPAPVPVPARAPASVYGYNGMAETEIGGETELWDSSADEMEACLEYYENGLMTRIVLDKPSTLVGRLQSQVDFAVSDPKVGKVHAEFINQDGKIYVKDLNSKNGTYLNGNIQRLNSNMLYPLNDNDRIALAKSEFILHCSVRQG